MVWILNSRLYIVTNYYINKTFKNSLQPINTNQVIINVTPRKSFQKLDDILQNRFSLTIEEYLNIREYFISSSWFALFKKGNYAHVHNHGDCDIAGVYYFKKVDDDGSLFFCNSSQVAECSIFKTGRITTNCSEGDILLFPGWMDHGVETNNTDDERISLSFNISFSR